MKRLLQLAIFALCVAFSVSAVYNVFSDNAEVEAMARLIACGEGQAAGASTQRAPGDESCRAQMTRLERTPFGQTFEFGTAKRAVGVRCQRAFLFVGGYACQLR